MPLNRIYPDYGHPCAPNTDPYYLSPFEEAEIERERNEFIDDAIEGAQADMRGALADMTAALKSENALAEYSARIAAIEAAIVVLGEE